MGRSFSHTRIAPEGIREGEPPTFAGPAP